MTGDGQTLWLCPDALFDGHGLCAGMAIGLRNARTTRAVPLRDLPAHALRQTLPGTLTAGFVDLQVNGGGDALLNAAPSRQAMRVMATAHRRFGTVAILPTVITDAPQVLAHAVEAALAAKDEPGVLGLHIEGPHLSIPRRGTHAAHWVRPFEPQTLAHVKRLCAEGIFVKITLAPEAMAPGQIAALVQAGAVVSIGHSDATEQATLAALAEGATCFTHLFNAMSPMQNREPGVTGAAIASAAYAGIICDGHHVSDTMIGLACRARPEPDRMFLVSDSMSTVGGSDRFALYGQEIRLVDGRLVNAEGSLAGAHVTMAEGLARLIRTVGIAPLDALKMAVTTPANLCRRPDLASVENREAGDILLLNDQWAVVGCCASLVKGCAA